MTALMISSKVSAVVLGLGVLVASSPARAVHADAALAKRSDCLKCHAIDKKKDGQAYKEVAARYKGKADAEQKLYVHLTTNPKLTVDGMEEEHTGLKTKDEAQVCNVLQWILSR